MIHAPHCPTPGQDHQGPCLLILPEADPVSQPSHYTFGKYEVIDVIEDWDLGFHLANVVKYVARAGRKDPAKTLEDLKKGRFYLDRHIKNLERDLR